MKSLSPMWIVRPTKRADTKYRLVCFPYAGGGASSFRSWPEVAPADVEVCSVQLPGREGRFREKPYRGVAAMVAGLLPHMSPLFDAPVVFFGHSLGALVAFELARALRRAGCSMPVHLVASGSRAPDRTHGEAHRAWVEGTDDEFVHWLMTLGGDSRVTASMSNAELMDLMLPTIRADFEAFVRYEHTVEPPLGIPISIFAGSEDHFIAPEDAAAWRGHTSAGGAFRTILGDHFFLLGREREMLRAIDADVSDTLGIERAPRGAPALVGDPMSEDAVPSSQRLRAAASRGLDG